MATSKETAEKLYAIKKQIQLSTVHNDCRVAFCNRSRYFNGLRSRGIRSGDIQRPVILGKARADVFVGGFGNIGNARFFREKELRENQDVTNTQKQIANAHAELIRRDLTTRFAEYVDGVNAERKCKAYRAFLQLKIAKARKEKARNKWQKLLDKADTDIAFLPTRGNTIKLSRRYHIKFYCVRMATIFSQVEQNSGDDENIETNEQAHIGNLVFKKLFTLIAFSLTLSTLFFDQGTFAVAILINTFSKLFRTAMSIALGASDGQSFVRGTLLSKMKLRLDFIQKFIEKEKSERGASAFAEAVAVE